MTLTVRVLLVTLCVALTGGYLRSTARAETVPIRQSLALCPTLISTWNGREAGAFDARTLEVLGVDEYINRQYANRRGGVVGLYIGFYGSQRQGDTIHSPLNCLPGAGWQPVKNSRIRIPVGAPTVGEPSTNGAIEVNRIVIEKGLDRQMVLYWYQSRGRVVASEYWGRFYLVVDAIRMNRTDGAMVRVISPIADSEDDAERDAVDFVQSLFPLLHAYLPS